VAKAAKKKIAKETSPLLARHRAAFAAIEAAYNDASRALVGAATEITKAAVEAWKAEGGCERCGGFQQVLTWSTMDSAGFDEHGPCTAPGCAYKPRPDWSQPWRSNHTHELGVIYAARKINPEYVEPLEQAAKNAEEAYIEAGGNIHAGFRQHQRGLFRGDVVIVTKGVKVPVGVIGHVVAIKEGAYGPRCGILDSSNFASRIRATAAGDEEQLVMMDEMLERGESTSTVHWLPLANVELCCGLTDEEKKNLEDSWKKNQEDFKKRVAAERQARWE